MIDDSELITAIRAQSFGAWYASATSDPKLRVELQQGDPTFPFMYWHAGALRRQLRLTLPARASTDLAAKQEGATIVELVEGTLLWPDTWRGSSTPLIRGGTPQQVTAASRDLVRALQGTRLHSYGPDVSYVVAIYMWVGCSGMAHTLRVMDRRGVSYTTASRGEEYQRVKNWWEIEERDGNAWVRFGVTLAIAFAIGRRNDLIHGWVETDSPYWEGYWARNV